MKKNIGIICLLANIVNDTQIFKIDLISMILFYIKSCKRFNELPYFNYLIYNSDLADVEILFSCDSIGDFF